jgi:hypothetical protein
MGAAALCSGASRFYRGILIAPAEFRAPHALADGNPAIRAPST